MKTRASTARQRSASVRPARKAERAIGQAAEAVDHPRLEIGGQRQRRRHAADEHGFEEDPRHHVVDVVDPGNMDGPAEHVAEQEQDDRRLYEGHEEQLGRADDPEEIPLRDALDVANGKPSVSGAAQLGRRLRHGKISHRWIPTVMVAARRRGPGGPCPVSERKTSSSDGRRIPRSSSAMPSSSMARPAAISTLAPPLIGSADLIEICGPARGEALPRPATSEDSPARDRSGSLRGPPRRCHPSGPSARPPFPGPRPVRHPSRRSRSPDARPLPCTGS